MKHRIIYITTPLLILFISGYIFFQSHQEDILLPPPYETIIVEGEDEDNHIKKQEWIEMIHRSAPEDNWRRMDQLYRIKKHSDKKDNKELPIYGKWSELGSNN